MKKTFAVTVLIMSLSIVLFSFSKATNNNSAVLNNATPVDTTASVAETDAVKILSNTIYDSLHLQNAGLSQDAVYYAVKGYEKLKEQGDVNNDRYLTIVDLSQSSRKKRFYILDMENEQLVWNTYVAHG